MITYISDTAHYKKVLTRIPQVKHSLWIGRHCKTCRCKDFCGDPIR